MKKRGEMGGQRVRDGGGRERVRDREGRESEGERERERDTHREGGERERDIGPLKNDKRFYCLKIKRAKFSE